MEMPVNVVVVGEPLLLKLINGNGYKLSEH